MAEVEEQQFENFEEAPVVAAAEEIEADVGYGATTELPEIKLFGRWSCDDVDVSDMSLAVSGSMFLFDSNIETMGRVLIGAFWFSPTRIISGLHCRQGKIRSLHTTFGWTLCGQTFP